jgi:Ca2+:H+ antiporter
MVLGSDEDKTAAHQSVLILSRGTAVILLLLYGLYLFFQLRTHKNLFNPEEPESAGEGDAEEEAKEPSMSAWSAAVILIATTVLISFCADYLVDAIDPIVATEAFGKNFIDLILIPIVGNAAEHVTACVVAIKNKMDLVSSDVADAFHRSLDGIANTLTQAMGVVVGSSVQIALLVTPFLVLLGWAIDRPMDFQFEMCKLPMLLWLPACFWGSRGNPLISALGGSPAGEIFFRKSYLNKEGVQLYTI